MIISDEINNLSVENARNSDMNEIEQVTSTRSEITADDALVPKCELSLRLLDGNAVKHTFKSTDNLEIVREWLDKNFDVLPQSSMPSFAKDHSFPSDYTFQSPSFPRITYSRRQEHETLEELHLLPRSVLTLKPMYTEIVKEKRSIIDIAKSNLSVFTNAVYSFFDYSVVENEEFEEVEPKPLPVLAINKMDIIEEPTENPVQSNTPSTEVNKSHDTPRMINQRSITKIQTVEKSEK